MKKIITKKRILIVGIIIIILIALSVIGQRKQEIERVRVICDEWAREKASDRGIIHPTYYKTHYDSCFRQHGLKPE